MKVSDFVEGKLMEIGATPEYTGYKYLVCAIVMSMQNEYLLNNVTTKVYVQRTRNFHLEVVQ